MSKWYGSSIQEALLTCEIVTEHKPAEMGGLLWYYLKLGDKIVPLGDDGHFAEMLQFALRRNARAFEHPAPQLPNGENR